jgi:hypothetical protein
MDPFSQVIAPLLAPGGFRVHLVCLGDADSILAIKLICERSEPEIFRFLKSKVWDVVFTGLGITSQKKLTTTNPKPYTQSANP